MKKFFLKAFIVLGLVCVQGCCAPAPTCYCVPYDSQPATVIYEETPVYYPPEYYPAYQPSYWGGWYGGSYGGGGFVTSGSYYGGNGGGRSCPPRANPHCGPSHRSGGRR